MALAPEVMYYSIMNTYAAGTNYQHHSPFHVTGKKDGFKCWMSTVLIRALMFSLLKKDRLFLFSTAKDALAVRMGLALPLVSSTSVTSPR